jgi:hypothetical protein
VELVSAPECAACALESHLTAACTRLRAFLELACDSGITATITAASRRRTLLLSP